MECFCGRSFATVAALDNHLVTNGCIQFATPRDHAAPIPPSVEAARKKAAQTANDIDKQGKKARARIFKDSRRKDVVLELAMHRYIKCISAAAVDSLKAMHTRANTQSRKYTMSELRENMLGKVVDEALLQHIGDILFDAFDTFCGIETESLEMVELKKIIPIIDPVGRPLPGTKKLAWDFKMDEVLLRLLNHCPAANRDAHETIVEWRTKRPETMVKIISDIVDAKVFLQHAVFGEAFRVTRAEAEAIAAAGGHIQWAIMLYGDAFCVAASLRSNDLPLPRPLDEPPAPCPLTSPLPTAP